MKHNIHSYIAISSILALLAPACTNQFTEAPQSMKAPRSFTAEMGEEDATKTALAENGTSVLWLPNDDINAFYGNTRIGRYTNYSDGAVTVAVFEGDGKSFIGATEDEGTKKNYWAVYPYNYKNTSDGESVNATLPDFQTATADNFAKGTLLTVAKSETTVLQFYHVCGGIKFSVTHPGIRQVELMGNNNEVLAGQLTITMDDNKRPVVTAVAEPQKTIRLTARDGDSFQVGKWYYITCLPVAFSQGFTLTLRSATETGVYTYSEPIEVKRAIWGSLSDVDDAVSYSPEDNKIEFPAPTEILYTSATGSVTSPCSQYRFSNYYDGFLDNLIANKYVDGLGHLVFKEGITEIPEYMFDGWNSIARFKTVIIPEGIKSIGYGAFERTTDLVSVEIPASVTTFGNYIFQDSNLSSAILAEGLTHLGNSIFLACFSLNEIHLPSTLERIDSSAFRSCGQLRLITIPDNCQVIQYRAFDGCSSLKEITLPNHAMIIESRAFASTRFSEFTIPDGSVVQEGVFGGCPVLNKFNSELATVDGRCLIKDGTLLALATYGITTYEIPEGVTRIGCEAITGFNLESLTFPSSVTEFGDNWLTSNSNFHPVQLIVKSINPPTIVGDCGLPYYLPEEEYTIYVPAGSVDAYKAAPVWSEHADHIQAIPGS